MARIDHDELLSIVAYNGITGEWKWRHPQFNRHRPVVNARVHQIKIRGKWYNPSTLAEFYMTGKWLEEPKPRRARAHALKSTDMMRRVCKAGTKTHPALYKEGVQVLDDGRFNPRICIDQVWHNLGVFDTREQAEEEFKWAQANPSKVVSE